MKKLLYFLIFIGFGLITGCDLVNPDPDDDFGDLPEDQVQIMKELSDGDIFAYIPIHDWQNPSDPLVYVYLDKKIVDVSCNSLKASDIKLINDSTLEFKFDQFPFEHETFEASKIGINYYEYGKFSKTPIENIYNGIYYVNGRNFKDYMQLIALDSEKQKLTIWCMNLKIKETVNYEVIYHEGIDPYIEFYATNDLEEKNRMRMMYFDIGNDSDKEPSQTIKIQRTENLFDRNYDLAYAIDDKTDNLTEYYSWFGF